MDRYDLLELVPHYLAMGVLLFLVLAVIRATVGELGIWIELPIMFAVVVAYRPAVRRLGLAPSLWE